MSQSGLSLRFCECPFPAGESQIRQKLYSRDLLKIKGTTLRSPLRFVSLLYQCLSDIIFRITVATEIHDRCLRMKYSSFYPARESVFLQRERKYVSSMQIALEHNVGLSYPLKNVERK